MRVILLNYTSGPEETIVRAIRECYQSFAKQDEVSDERLLRHITKNEESPLEFADFTFLIEGVSRACSHQLVRHRVASWAQKSQRYCSEKGFKYVVPEKMALDSAAYDVYKQVMEEIEWGYKELIKFGAKKEDARYLLPNACETSLVCKFNARSLRHFLKLRLGKRAQWEIRNVAREMLREVQGVTNIIVEDFVLKEFYVANPQDDYS